MDWYFWMDWARGAPRRSFTTFNVCSFTFLQSWSFCKIFLKYQDSGWFLPNSLCTFIFCPLVFSPPGVSTCEQLGSADCFMVGGIVTEPIMQLWFWAPSCLWRPFPSHSDARRPEPMSCRSLCSEILIFNLFLCKYFRLYLHRPSPTDTFNYHFQLF